MVARALPALPPLAKEVSLAENDSCSVSHNLTVGSILEALLASGAAGTLERLDVSDNNLSDTAAAHLAATLPACRRLCALNVSDNKMASMSARHLSEAMTCCTALTCLNLGGNDVRAGASDLAGALAGGPLQRLDLRGNNLWDQGVDSLSQALPAFGALQTLNLRGNKMGVWGAASLARVMPQCLQLRHVDLGGNWLGDEGAVRIAESLGRCGKLEFVGLTWNNIRREGRRSLELVRVSPHSHA